MDRRSCGLLPAGEKWLFFEGVVAVVPNCLLLLAREKVEGRTRCAGDTFNRRHPNGLCSRKKLSSTGPLSLSRLIKLSHLLSVLNRRGGRRLWNAAE